MNHPQADQYLPNRGILAETADAHQVRVVHTPSSEQLELWVGKNGVHVEAAIVFPNLILDADGSVFPKGYAVRCFPPVVRADGSEAKFLATLGVEYQPYVLPSVWGIAHNITTSVCITEKQTVALLLRQIGQDAVAVEGVWGTGAKREDSKPITLHPSLARFDWVNRSVYLLFDSDFLANQNVLQGLVRAFLLFTVAQANVRIVTWDKAYKGFDDLIANRAGLDVEKQRQEFAALIEPWQNLSREEAAAKWILPNMLTLFEREGAKIAMSPAVRNQLAHLLKKPLGASVGSLEESWGAEKAEAASKSNIIREWPEPSPTHVNPLDLMSKVTKFIARFVVMTPSERTLIFFWSFLPWTVQLWPKLAILRITSPEKQCGKSTALDVLEQLIPNPFLTINISAAALYRLIEALKPTVLVDEADSFASTREDFRNIACGGFDRNRPVVRFNTETQQVETFQTHGCRVIASIGSLHETIEDRSVFVQLTKKAYDQEVEQLTDVPAAEFEELRQMYARVVAGHFGEFASQKLKRPEAFVSREWDKYRPLLTIASVFGCYELALRAFTTVMRAYDPQTSVAIEILLRMRVMFKVCSQPEKFLFTHAVVLELNKDKEAPWGDLKDQLTQKKLAGYLRPFKIKSRNKQDGAGNQAKAYFYEDFKNVFKSYLGLDPNDPGSPTDRGSSTPVPDQKETETKRQTEEGSTDPLKTQEIRPQPVGQVPEPISCGRINSSDPSTGRIYQNNPSTANPLPEPIPEPWTDKMPFSGVTPLVSSDLADAWEKRILRRCPSPTRSPFPGSRK
jgi:hypothetical protein